MLQSTTADRTDTVVLTVPGLSNSGPQHWQTLWERNGNHIRRVDLGMWDDPRRNSWVTNLSHAIRSAHAPVVLCAHSLGCLAVVWWALMEATRHPTPVVGALLVAPPDVDCLRVAPALARFAPTPEVLMPFPTVVVASRDDRYASIERSREMAEMWGSRFVDVGALGHINAESGLGAWPDGQTLLLRLLNGLATDTPPASSPMPGTGQPVAGPHRTAANVII